MSGLLDFFRSKPQGNTQSVSPEAADFQSRVQPLIDQADTIDNDDARDLVKSLGAITRDAVSQLESENAELRRQLSKGLPADPDATDDDATDDDAPLHDDDDAPLDESALDDESALGDDDDLDDDDEGAEIPAPGETGVKPGLSKANVGDRSADDAGEFAGEAIDAAPVLEGIAEELAIANRHNERNAKMLSKSMGQNDAVLKQNQALMKQNEALEARLDNIENQMANQNQVQGEISKSLESLGMRPLGTMNGRAPVVGGVLHHNIAPGAQGAMDDVTIAGDGSHSNGRSRDQIIKSLLTHIEAGHDAQSGVGREYLERFSLLSPQEMQRVNDVVDKELAGNYSKAPATSAQ